MNFSTGRIVVYTIIFILIFSFYIAIISISPKRFRSNITPNKLGLEYESVEFITKDNIKIRGWFIPSNKSKEVIIVGHGYPFDKGNVLEPTIFLHDKFNLLYFDLRSFGESEGKITTGSLKEVHDFDATVNFVKEKGFKKIGAYGFSLSASTFLFAKNKDIKAIVAEAPFANLNYIFRDMYKIFWVFKWPFVWISDFFSLIFFKKHLSEIGPLNNIQDNKAKILLIHGTKDSQINYKNSIILHEKNPKTELWLIEGADHGEGHFIKKKEYEERVVGFFEKGFRD